MTFWDFIFGDKDIGWLKTALCAGLLGLIVLVILGLLFSAPATGSEEELTNKFIFIFIGLPIRIKFEQRCLISPAV